MARDKDDESKDEYVDGPAAAARILDHMNPANKEKIMKEINRLDPGLAHKIELNLSNFDDIIELTPQSIQLLIQKVEHSDLVLSMKMISQEAREALISNMSQRKRQTVEEDISALPPCRLSDVEEAQRRILNILEQLREQGLVRSRAKSDLYI